MSESEQTRAGRLVAGTTEPVDAATVVLVRDRDTGGGFEVLLLERHLDSDFAGGALVFPGGKVDPADRDLPADRWHGSGPADRVGLLGAADAGTARGLLVAAVRETFEEAGVLYAHRDDGRPVTAVDLDSRSFATARERLADRSGRWDWRPWLEAEQLVLDLDQLAPWSWWVTPPGQHRRFDTRFFVARLPAGQQASHDRVETTALRWMTPQDALLAEQRGEATVIFPTRRNLASLAGHRTASDVWDAAVTGAVDLRRIEPEVVRVGGKVMVRHPDDDQPERV